MEVFDAQNYREYLRYCLKGLGRNARGAVVQLAEKIRAHPTYISQVLNSKADLNTDQGLGFCEFVNLNQEQTEFFLDLLSRDRARTKAATKHFELRLGRHLSKHRELKSRLKLKESLTLEQKAFHFKDWTPQTVHMLCQLSGKHTE